MPVRNSNTNNSGHAKKSGGHEAFGVGLIIVSAFFLLCLAFPMILSSIGEWIRSALTGCFGAFAYALFTVTLFWGIFILRGNKLAVSKKRAVFILLLCVFGLLLLQMATTHKLLKQDTISAYLSSVFDYSKNFSIGGAFCGIFAYGLKSVITIAGAYIFFAFLFALFALLLGMDIIASRRPIKENKRNYKVKGKQNPVNPIPFIKSGAESAPIKPVSNNGLFVGNIIPRSVSSEGGSFSEIEKKREKPQKKLSDFFDSIKNQKDQPVAEKEKVNAKNLLFADYEKMQEESAARFMSSLNSQRELPRDDLGRGDAVKTPRGVASAPDIKDEEIESPLKKADKKNLEVVFPPAKEAPKIVPGEIINAEKASGSIKNRDTAKFRPPEPDRYYYDEKYNFEDKEADAQEFLDRPKTVESAPYLSDAALDSASQAVEYGDFPAPGEIINGDLFDPSVQPVQEKPVQKHASAPKPAPQMSEKKTHYETIYEDSGSYRLYPQKRDTIYEDVSGYETPVKEPIFEMPVSTHSFFDSEPVPADARVQPIQPYQIENSFDYSPRQEPEPVFNQYPTEIEDEDILDGFGDDSDNFIDSLNDNSSVLNDTFKAEFKTEFKDNFKSESLDNSLDFGNPYGEESISHQPDLTFVKRINQYEETLRKGEKQAEKQAAPQKEKPAAQYAAEDKKPAAPFSAQEIKPAAPYEIKPQAAETKTQDTGVQEPDYTGYYLKKEEPAPEKTSTFSQRTAALNRKIDPKNQINMEGYMSAAANSSSAAAEQPKPKKKRSSRYTPPPSDLLTCESTNADDYGADYEANITLLEETLRNLKLPAKVKNITRGPAVTRYELEMPPGTTVKRIEGFSQDIAYALASSGGIRIEAPIPGKRAVGVEVPNSTIGIVGLRDLIESPEFNKNPSHMSICIGKDIAGKNIVAPLEKMPHLLVAGSTGSGKSACLHSIIISILYKSSPADVRLILIDPKRVEFPFYKNLPHLLINQIVNEREHAINAFKWVKEEMTARYKQLAKIGARNQQEFNMSAAVRSGDEEKLPSIVIVVDELSDLMSGGLKKEMEEHILSIAQLGRAAGIHLILATQRPSVDVITGTIKVNFPSRIALAVSNAVDSKTILDQSGAEMLLGRGDLLYAPIDAPDPKRIQGAYVTGDEVEEIVKFIYENNPAEYYDDVEGIIMREKEKEADDADEEDDEGDDEFDSLLEEVARKVIETGQASTSMMQRRFKLGYARASRIIDQLERYGFIGPMDINRPTKPREVFITRESFRDFFGHDY